MPRNEQLAAPTLRRLGDSWQNQAWLLKKEPKQQFRAILRHFANELSFSTATAVYTNYVPWPRAAISSFSSIGWIFSRGSDAIPFPQPKPRTVRIHIIMPSVCSRKVAQLEWSGVRKGENVLQPFNLCDRLLGIHSALISTRRASLKESGFGQKLEPVPTGVGDVYTRYQSDPHTLVIGPKLTQVAM